SDRRGDPLPGRRDVLRTRASPSADRTFSPGRAREVMEYLVAVPSERFIFPFRAVRRRLSHSLASLEGVSLASRAQTHEERRVGAWSTGVEINMPTSELSPGAPSSVAASPAL